MPAVVTPPTPAGTTTPPPAVATPASPASVWAPLRWTIEDYRRLGTLGLFQDMKVMLIDGEIFTMTMPNPPHDVALGKADDWLRTVFTTGHHVRNQMGFDVGTKNDPGPDLAVVIGSRGDYATRTPTTAVMIIEVADSSLAADTTKKAELYATASVPEYWVIDLEHRQLIIFRDPQPLPAGLGATAYKTHLTFGPTDRVSPLAVPIASVLIGDLLP